MIVDILEENIDILEEKNKNEDTNTDKNNNETETETENETETKNKKNNIKNEIVFEPKTEKGKFKVDCWHTEKNGDLTPRDVSKKSRKLCWFTCDVCGHDFQRTIKHIVTNNKWCLYCYENLICDNDDCEICFDKSFASFGE